MADYVAHRLQVAGGNSHVAFDERAIRLIHKRSSGIPRIVNAISDNAMLAGYVTGARIIGKQHVKKALAEMEYA